MEHLTKRQRQQTVAESESSFPEAGGIFYDKAGIYQTRKIISAYLCEELRPILDHLPVAVWKQLQEIRLRIGQPLLLLINGKPWFFQGENLIPDWRQSDFLVTRKMLNDTVLLISHHSFYALEQEFQHGFVTIPGGHRVGIAGKGVLRDGRLQTIKDVSSLNIRIAKNLPGISKPLMPYLLQNGRARSALLIGPPGCGKTTLLRDIVRNFSEGHGGRCLQVGVVDERSEIGCSFLGTPQLNVGPCTDILDGVPKAVGMELFLRVMGHDVVVTDEISGEMDCNAVQDLCGCGVAVIASVHGHDLESVLRRKPLGTFLQTNPFDYYIVLSKRQGAGTIESVYDKGCRPVKEGLQCG